MVNSLVAINIYLIHLTPPDSSAYPRLLTPYPLSSVSQWVIHILFLNVYLFSYLDPNIQGKAIYSAVVLIYFCSVSALLMIITLWTFSF